MDAMKNEQDEKNGQNGSQLIYRDHGQLVIGAMTTDAERARVPTCRYSPISEFFRTQ
ncbi:MAG: hypothetical protein U1E92_03245 [Moraxella osloensis]